MLDAISKEETRKVFKPKHIRTSSKSFEDLSLKVRKKSLFDSPAGKHFEKILPAEIWDAVVKAVLETGLESVETQKWVDYATGFDKNGRPRSPIAQSTISDFKDPRSFLHLYGEEDAITPMDVGYLLTEGAHAIDLRLQSIVAKLPEIILAERKRLGLKEGEKYTIFNIGAGHCLDTIYLLDENPELRNLVSVICIDSNKEALGYGEKLAEKLEVQESFQFIPEKIEKVQNLGKAHLILFIGMFCPVPTDTCIFCLSLIKEYLLDNGIVVFSTVQEKMLEEGALLDFIMASYGWYMYFKEDDEPGQIAEEAGLVHEKFMDWEDALGHNRMTVARKVS